MTESSVTRRDFHRLILAAGAGFLVSPPLSSSSRLDLPFVHPGLLHSVADLERMRDAVRAGREPIAAGFEKLRQHPLSSPNYVPHKFGDEIGRNPSINFGEFDSDANAAYQCSLMAAITGDNRYATVARAIVLGWSASLQRVSGADAVLMAGLGPFKFVNAAEILRHMNELDEPGATSCVGMLHRAILPTIIDFAPFANGNWDTAAVKTMLAIAVFCDDQALFERALLYYLHGDGDGSLNHYIYENGQCQESGRDQQHTQLGLAHMGDACQIAWNQGWDLYGAQNNRLLRGFEYTAAYNLGEQVEFRPDVDQTGHYRHNVISPPGALRPVYEQILAHYQVLRGLAAPAVAKAVEKLRPEGAAQGADHTGFGTLLYARTADDPSSAPWPVLPIALNAVSRGKTIELDWLKPRAAASSVLKRNGVRMHVSPDSGSFRDAHIAPGRQYTYRFAADTIASFTPTAISIMSGLPSGWAGVPLGNPAVAGNVQFDGEVIAICAAGRRLMQSGNQDEGFFVAVPQSTSRIRVRFIPQVASQFVTFGIAYRSGFAADAGSVALLVMPSGGARERRDWTVRLMARDASGTVTILSDSPLALPVVSYGRLMKPVWLRLEANDSLLTTAFSTDGSTWVGAGQSARLKQGRIGLIASSGIPEITTVVRFKAEIT
ncbi:MAG TPA: alginate lyase family protein [Terracidiphilus sp.]|nr:alginate lyase family protein [Terracidiphilus sp.]